MVIEVAESSLATDRGKKLCLYAACGVPEYWIVNLLDSRIEVHKDLRDGAYARIETLERGQSIRLGAFPDLEIQVADVLK